SRRRHTRCLSDWSSDVCSSDLFSGTIYGYRVHGPYEPENGYRFNPAKLLLDPYAKTVHDRLQWHPALFGYAMESGDDLSFDERRSEERRVGKECRSLWGGGDDE